MNLMGEITAVLVIFGMVPLGLFLGHALGVS